MTIATRLADGHDRGWIVTTARELLGDETQVHSRRQFTVLEGEVLIAIVDGARVGFATWDHTDAVAELLAIGVRTGRRGAGRALVAAVRDHAHRAGCVRLVVVTTDENVDAQRFYEALGFTLVEQRVGAVDECRRRYKPTIPQGIHDELEYATDLDHDAREEAPPMTESTQYYWCTDHGRVEPADQACGMEFRIGPFDSADAAEHWQDRVDQRNEEWDAADRAWEGED